MTRKPKRQLSLLLAVTAVLGMLFLTTFCVSHQSHAHEHTLITHTHHDHGEHESVSPVSAAFAHEAGDAIPDCPPGRPVMRTVTMRLTPAAVPPRHGPQLDYHPIAGPIDRTSGNQTTR